MDYLGDWQVGDNLYISINTHTPATGASTDADADPTWRCYIDETGGAIQNGTFSKLDDANTTGFYQAVITLSAFAGYENDKSYTVYVSAVVGGITGTTSFSFRTRDDLATATSIAALNDLSAAEVNAEVDTALADINLDHLVGTATGIPAVPSGTYLDQIMDDGTAAYDRTTDSLQAIRDRGDSAWAGGTTFPSGSVTFTYTITNSVSGLPIEGVEVWFSTDNPAVNIVWKGDTDAFGVARDVNGNKPTLDPGTYYVWRQKAGFVFTDPDTEIVS